MGIAVRADGTLDSFEFHQDRLVVVLVSRSPSVRTLQAEGPTLYTGTYKDGSNPFSGTTVTFVYNTLTIYAQVGWDMAFAISSDGQTLTYRNTRSGYDVFSEWAVLARQ